MPRRQQGSLAALGRVLHRLEARLVGEGTQLQVAELVHGLVGLLPRPPAQAAEQGAHACHTPQARHTVIRSSTSRAQLTLLNSATLALYGNKQ